MSAWHHPANLDDVWPLLAAYPDARPMAGGTDLLVALRRATEPAPPLIGLEGIPELARIEPLPDGGVRIGACVTFASLTADPLLRERYSLLAQAAATVGGPAIRNMATLGGNIATASPAGDSLPPLHLLDARVELLSAAGWRELPLADFITGPRRTALRPGELIGQVRLPAPRGWQVQHFEKAAVRHSLAIAVVSLAAALGLDEDGRVKDARFRWGSVGPVVQTCPEAEAFMLGRRPDRATLLACADMARRCVQPIDDGRASADYRRHLAGNLLLRLAR